jgi:hypothetical protein
MQKKQPTSPPSDYWNEAEHPALPNVSKIFDSVGKLARGVLQVGACLSLDPVPVRLLQSKGPMHLSEGKIISSSLELETPRGPLKLTIFR